MQMMYEMIYNALKEVGLENKYEPQDYLNFFCLGNREVPDREDSLVARDSNAVKTPQVFPLSA
jgi:phospholipase D1/2